MVTNQNINLYQSHRTTHQSPRKDAEVVRTYAQKTDRDGSGKETEVEQSSDEMFGLREG